MKILIAVGLLSLTVTTHCQDGPQLIPYRKGNLWGYANKQGRLVIAPTFNGADVFGYSTNCCHYANLARVKKGGRSYLIDKRGKLTDEAKILRRDANEAPPPQTEELSLSPDVAAQDGSVTNDGEIVVAAGRYDKIFVKPQYNKYFTVTKNGLQGVVDRKQNTVLPIQYSLVESFAVNEYYDDSTKESFIPRFFAVKETGDSLYRLIGLSGQQVKSEKLYRYKPLSNFIAFQLFSAEGKPLWGVMDRKLRVVVKPKYKEIVKEEDGGLFLVQPYPTKNNGNSLPGYVTENGKEFFE